MPFEQQNAADDRRTARRAKTLRTGLIIYDEGRCTMACMILDQSRAGAKIRPQDSIWLPESFDLRLPDGSRRHCDLVRKERADVAVRYVA